MKVAFTLIAHIKVPATNLQRTIKGTCNVNSTLPNFTLAHAAITAFRFAAEGLEDVADINRIEFRVRKAK